MKPTAQVSHNRQAGFPLTDSNYQPTLDALYTGTKEKCVGHGRHGFWRLGAEFHGAEAVYGDAADFLIFTLMGLFCTWPIVAVVFAISRAFNGY